MGRIPAEGHLVMHEPCQPAALKGVGQHPTQPEIPVTHGLFDPRDHAVRLALGLDLGVGVPAKLQVDPVDVVGLLVQKHRLAGVEIRIEPEPALGRKIVRISMSAIRKRSSKSSPSKSRPIIVRMSLRAPSKATSYPPQACKGHPAYRPSGSHDRTVTGPRPCSSSASR